jgi:GT2 family glycosyltransferase
LKPVRIGIVVLNYNGAEKTVACLESLQLLRQGSLSLQIVVVDNSSQDESVKIISSAWPDIKLIKSSTNLGYAGGNNLGVAYFMNIGIDYIWILNNDTLVQPETLEKMLNKIEGDPAVGCVGSLIREIGPGGDQPILAVGGGTISWVFGTARHLKDVNKINNLEYITGASMLISKSAWESIGGLCEDYFLYWEDVDFCLRLKRHGWKLAVAIDAEVRHDESATLGRHSLLLIYYMNRAFVRFSIAHSSFFAWTILAGCFARMTKRLLLGRWAEARMVWRATIDGWNGRKGPYLEMINRI